MRKIDERSWEEIMKNSEEELHEDVVFPDRLRFEREGQAMLLAETKWWSSVGGPLPYHDSVTISFFSAQKI